MTLFDRENLYATLAADGLGAWVADLRAATTRVLTDEKHGNLPGWIAAWNQLPDVPDAVLLADRNAVTIQGTISDVARKAMRETLMAFHPWRKGPFDLFGIAIDTEWRSCLKWDRLVPHVEFRERKVLDVGCGNGYYGWRMLNAGAELVLGLDPFPLFLMQFEAIRKYADPNLAHYVLPLSDQALPERLNAFDVTVSMGVLYHRTSPIDHLQALWHSLRPGGTLVLETLVIDSAEKTVLVPEDRYAKMRNVWFIPSIPMLLLWLKRAGFRNAEVIDLSRTTPEEQRRTDWMTFESLADFLDAKDPNRTFEGYPAPLRAMIVARKS
ncbi:MAG TPA: tRNA 5-methoxyuridine(34)/uridine 5-oxyacetic acid(34) synthase CmoB [Planctomycetaceae bacterium]|nr:tRNA 5-methoxyuridine(34)/uridine 5-oxyacetic acid(34) synthase CmoB [Planctomycetaceae bacterium]